MKTNISYFLAIAYILFLLAFAISTTSCGSSSTSIKSKVPDCIKPGMKDMLIRWGVWIDSTGNVQGYELDAHSIIWKYSASTKKENYIRDSICTISIDRLCSIVDTVRKTFLSIQSYTVLAPRMYYVEYQNPAGNVNLRAVWDSRFQTYGSKEFRAIFDSLCTIANVKD